MDFILNMSVVDLYQTSMKILKIDLLIYQAIVHFYCQDAPYKKKGMWEIQIVPWISNCKTVIFHQKI